MSISRQSFLAVPSGWSSMTTASPKKMRTSPRSSQTTERTKSRCDWARVRVKRLNAPSSPLMHTDVLLYGGGVASTEGWAVVA